MGGSSGQNTTATTTTDIPPAFLPFFQSLFGNAQAASEQSASPGVFQVPNLGFGQPVTGPGAGTGGQPFPGQLPPQQINFGAGQFGGNFTNSGPGGPFGGFGSQGPPSGQGSPGGFGQNFGQGFGQGQNNNQGSFSQPQPQGPQQPPQQQQGQQNFFGGGLQAPQSASMGFGQNQGFGGQNQGFGQGPNQPQPNPNPQLNAVTGVQNPQQFVSSSSIFTDDVLNNIIGQVQAQNSQLGPVRPGGQQPAPVPTLQDLQAQAASDPFGFATQHGLAPEGFNQSINPVTGEIGFLAPAAPSSGVGQPFPGPFTAPTDAREVAALQSRDQLAQQFSGAGNNLFNLGQAQAGGAFLNSNPFRQQAINSSLQPAVDQFTRSTIPQFNSAAIGAGLNKGSSARDLAFGNLANDFGRNLAQTAGSLGFSDFQQERQLQQGSGQLIDQGASLNQLSPELLAQTGLGFRELNQRLIDEELLRFQEATQAPFRPLGPLANIIQGGDVGAVSSITQPRPSKISGGITGALGGAGLGLGLASAGGLSGGNQALSSLLGGLGGGALGAFA